MTTTDVLLALQLPGVATVEEAIARVQEVDLALAPAPVADDSNAATLDTERAVWVVILADESHTLNPIAQKRIDAIDAKKAARDK